MRSISFGPIGVALVLMIACGGSGDSNNGTGGSSGKGGTGGKAGDGGVTGGTSGTGATGGGGTSGGGTGASTSGGGTTATGGAAGSTAGTGGAAGGTAGGGGTVATGGTGGGGPCVPATCQGKTYQCGDCLDNDGDGLIDSADPDCWGTCQDNESGYKGNIPGQANQPCIEDCYFDQDSGSGNDQCYWDHRCDPYEVAPNYPPEGIACTYDPNQKVISGGAPWSCTQALTTQKQECLNFCGPLVPNGCDCFGCCNAPGAPTPIWLGSVDSAGVGTCDPAHVADPAKCHPCTIVTGCFNDCKECELCFGKPTLPASCFPSTGGGGGGGTGGTTSGGGGTTSGGGGTTSGGGGTTSGGGGTGGSCVAPLCPAGIQACGLACLPSCPSGTYCVTGCCQQVIK